MAQQKGIIPLKGTIGNLTFYKSKDGFLTRGKGGVDAKRIATDPAFQRTRENNAEFARAGKASKLLSNSVRAFTQNASDSKMISRLIKAMMTVIQADATNARGLRNVINGEAELLNGFEFNDNGKLSATLYAPFTATIDRVAGTLTVAIPAFVPLNMITAPPGATHFKINSAGVEIDFEGNVYVVNTNSSTDLPWDNVLTGALSLVNTVTANSTHPLFLLAGIEFSQQVNGTRYPLKNGAFNALSLVKISGQ
jgi:hypothetical protein